MNKILRYSFIAILAFICGGAFAQTTIDFTKLSITKNTDGYSVSDQGFTFSAVKSKGATSPTQNGTTKDVRHYPKNVLTISGTKMSQIVFTMSDQGKKQWGDVTPSVGTVTVDKAAGTTTWVCAEGATSLTLTVGDKNVYGSNASKTAAQFDLNSAVISAETSGEVKSSAKLAFSNATVDYEVGATFTAPTFTKSTTAAVSFASDNEAVAKVSAEGVISLGGEEGKAVITATSAENDEYYAGSATCTIYVYHMNVYKKATSIESGKGYLLVAKKGGKTYYAYPLTSNYGYLRAGLVDGDVDQISIKSSYNDEFVFTTEGDGYSIKANDNAKYYIQKDEYKSFNLSDTPAAWTVEAQNDGTYKISMNGYYMQFGESTNTTFGVYTEAVENAVLPMLFELDKTATGVKNITAEAAAKDAPLYNLAGQKVSKAYKGVVIQNGKKFVNK